MTWTIWYADGTQVHGTSAAEWRAAPDHGVQVVVQWRAPGPRERPWTGVTDRFLWTGEDGYDPFGYGPKYGSWLEWSAYEAIWQEAAYGCHHA